MNLVCYYLIRFYSNHSFKNLEAPVLAFTSWTYQRPQSPAMTKQPYLFRPDYRPTGAYGHKRMLLLKKFTEFFYQKKKNFFRSIG